MTQEAAAKARRKVATTVRTLTPRLPPRHACCFHRRAGRRLATPRRRPHRLGLDHLSDRGGADLEVDVRVRLDRHVPARCDLELLIDALEALFRVRDRVRSEEHTSELQSR